MARVAGQRNLHLHHHYPRQQLAPTSRFPSNAKGYAFRVRRTTSTDQPKKAYLRGRGGTRRCGSLRRSGHQQKIAVINHLAKKVASVADVNLRPGHTSRPKEKKFETRQIIERRRTFNALVHEGRKSKVKCGASFSLKLEIHFVEKCFAYFSISKLRNSEKNLILYNTLRWQLISY